MDSLTLNSATRKTGVYQTTKEYPDFIISGRSLKAILNIETADYITFLGRGQDREDEQHILNVFRL